MLGVPDVVDGIKIGCGITLPKTTLIHLKKTMENNANIEVEITNFQKSMFQHCFSMKSHVSAFYIFDHKVRNCKQL